MAYLFDADVFLEAKNRHYGLDFCPAFWEWVATAHAAGQVFSIARVQTELRDADISAWARAQPDGFFLPVEDDDLPSLQAVTEWAFNQPNYIEAARNDFLSKADFHLVGQALAGGHTVVTHEGSHPESTKRIMIPDACNGVGVEWTNIFDVLRALGARFILDA